MHVRFSYQAPTAGKHEVGILGDFTEWKIQSLQDMGGLYVISYELKAGRYLYKLIVDGIWMPDPSHHNREADPYGGENSFVVVEEMAELPDWEEVIAEAQSKGLGAFLDLQQVSAGLFDILFKWPLHLADSVDLTLGGINQRMNRIAKTSSEGIWCLRIKLEEATGLLFKIIHQERELYLGSSISMQEAQVYQVDPQDYPVFAIPNWVQSGIIYQIFMDRFHNGDPGLNQDFRESYYADCRTPPPKGEFLAPNQEYYHFEKDWYAIEGLRQSPYQPEGMPDWWCFYGGDICGVKEKLDYLQELGVSILYFNPLWEAKSVHKYDAADFRKVDSHFGTARDLQLLVKEAHSRGMRVILDVAFNHSGESFWAFQDCVLKGEESHYWHWYDWFKWPLPKPLPIDFKPKEYYQCWWGIKDMPDLNYDLSRRHPFENYIRDIGNAEVNDDLVNYILDSAEWWITYIDMDGFRLDVPDEVPWWFWELFRSRVKEIKSDAWLVGEIWNNARAWISHRYFDSVMNYAYFNSPVLEFFIHRLIAKAEFQSQIETGLAMYPPHAARAMMNLLGSHDTQRVMQLAKGDLRRVKQAVFFQMTFIGTPHIYYGDEIAMAGGKDPDNRRPFNWQWESDPTARDLRDFYLRCICLRKNNQLLIDGDFEFLDSNNGLLIYRRFEPGWQITCVVNISSRKQTLRETPGEIIFTEGKISNGAKGYVLEPYAMCVLN
ncbi:MAG: alpha-amylase family glycosyl hydrolase [Candidatus Cloacimonadaceae bacterium]|jgi:glycosidase|nr:alpha-amylase family glycosyl hydrolase [Candidatus Cloacimonadaceae bacterium]